MRAMPTITLLTVVPAVCENLRTNGERASHTPATRTSQRGRAADGILSAHKASTTTTTPVITAFTSGPPLNDSTYGETISQTPIASTIGTIHLLTTVSYTHLT